MKLYEIDAAIDNLFDPETGEITDPEAWDALQMEREKKLENIACLYKSLKAEETALKEEEDSFRDRRRAVANRAENIKGFLERSLAGDKLKTTRCMVSYRASEAVQISDPTAFVGWAIQNGRTELLKQPEINLTAVKSMLKGGEESAFATICQRQNMQVR